MAYRLTRISSRINVRSIKLSRIASRAATDSSTGLPSSNAATRNCCRTVEDVITFRPTVAAM
jgi:hypothetical protein